LTATALRARLETKKGDAMAYSVACKDSGADCPGSFTTETKDELIKHVELHAQVAHPGLELTRDQIEGLVKETAAA
jgi:predicted small metal-binding protein